MIKGGKEEKKECVRVSARHHVKKTLFCETAAQIYQHHHHHLTFAIQLREKRVFNCDERDERRVRAAKRYFFFSRH
jgi:hypothetical protein